MNGPKERNLNVGTAEKQGSRQRVWVLRLAALLFALTVGLVFVELGFRWLGPPTYGARRILPNGVPFTTGPGRLLQYQPNSTFYAQYDPRGCESGDDGRIDYRINNLGFRGDTIGSKAAGVYRIVCLGDSFTFGEGVEESGTWPNQLAGILSDKRGGIGASKIEVINAGVQGHGLLDCVLNYGVHETDFDADAVILTFFMNDLVAQRETIRLNDELHRDRPTSGLASWSRVVDFFDARATAQQQQADMLDAIRSSFDEDGCDTFNEAIAGLRDYLNEKDVQLLVVVYPLLWSLDADYPLQREHRFIDESLEAAGVPVVDLLDALKNIPASSLWAHPTDHHPNARAHRIAAEQVARKLDQLN